MTQGTTTVQTETHKGMLGGGIATVSGGGLGLVIIVVVGVLTEHTIPTGWSALAAVGTMVGSMLVLAGIILRHVDRLMGELAEHRAEHQAVALDAEDITTIRRQVGEILTFIARYDLERKDERKLVVQVEDFLAWRAAAERRLAVLEGDNVIDIETVRAVHEVRKHLPNQDD